VLTQTCKAIAHDAWVVAKKFLQPDLRQAAESVLQEGETLSGFVESSLVKQIEFRKSQQEFIARGMASREPRSTNAQSQRRCESRSNPKFQQTIDARASYNPDQ